MNHASFRFYAQLNRFVEGVRRYSDSDYAFWGSPAVKDAVEALGVPHTEVALILVNGTPVDFAHQLNRGDRVSVFPHFQSLDLAGVSLQPGRPDSLRFIIDGHLGRLARYLRMLGFDTRYRPDRDDATLARIADEEDRLLLTRDRHLLQRSRVQYGSYVHSTDPREQLKEVVRRFNLGSRISPFSRCLMCNTPLINVEKQAVEDLVPADTLECYDRFRKCERCGRVFWKGSHYDRMQALIDEIREW